MKSPKRDSPPRPQRQYLRSKVCKDGFHRSCSRPDTCGCYCHYNADKGDVRPGVPPPNAAHFVRETLRDSLNTALKRAFINGLPKADIGQVAWDVLTDMGFEAVVKAPKSVVAERRDAADD